MGESILEIKEHNAAMAELYQPFLWHFRVTDICCYLRPSQFFGPWFHESGKVLFIMDWDADGIPLEGPEYLDAPKLAGENQSLYFFTDFHKAFEAIRNSEGLPPFSKDESDRFTSHFLLDMAVSPCKGGYPDGRIVPRFGVEFAEQIREFLTLDKAMIAEMLQN